MLLILAGVSINLVLGNNGIIAKSKDAREQTQRAEAKDDVDLAVANMQIEAAQRTMTQEEKRQSIENELKKIRSESTVTINGDGFKANHKGYEFEISDTGKTSVNKPDEPFEASKWDRTAAPEDVFVWGSNDPSSPDYGKVVGYKKNLDNYPVLRYPSRCTSVGVDYDYITGTAEEKDTIRSYTKNVKKIELPETLKKIEESAFSCGRSTWSGNLYGYNFKEVKEINIPNSVISIGEGAFSGCEKLISMIIPSNVTSIEKRVFENCRNLESVTLGDDVTGIGDYAFAYCGVLSSITIPDGVISIGQYAFEECRGLSSLTIPDSVTSIGDYAFFGVNHIEYHGTAPDSQWGARWGASTMN